MFKANIIHLKNLLHSVVLNPFPPKPSLSLWLIAGLMLFLSYSVIGLPEDRQQPIRISSNSAIKDEKRGITIYEGDVNIDQGTLSIKGDKITVYLESEQVSRIVAEGKPAHFKQKPAPEKDYVEAKAFTIEYQLVQKTISLTDQAFLNQNGQITRSNKIHYNIDDDKIEAGSAGGRVTILLPPQKEP